MVEAMAFGHAIALLRGLRRGGRAGAVSRDGGVWCGVVWRPLGTSDWRADGLRCHVEWVYIWRFNSGSFICRLEFIKLTCDNGVGIRLVFELYLDRL